jgi:hypothetical protein
MRIQDVSRIFSSSQLQAVARGDLSYLQKVAKTLELETVNFNELTVGGVFDCIFSIMLKKYRNEYVFKNRLVESSFLKKYSPENATLVTELRVGRCVADAVLINGTSTCFEIKTEYDSLSRLSDQLAAYRKIFDKVVVVAAETHIDDLLIQLPEDIGLTLLTKGAALKVLRKPGDLSNQSIDISVLAGTLRLKELIKLTKTLTDQNLPLSNIEVYHFCTDVLLNSDPSKVRLGFRKVLKSCRKQDAAILSSVPKSLKNAFVSYSFTTKELNGLLTYLKFPLT